MLEALESWKTSHIAKSLMENLFFERCFIAKAKIAIIHQASKFSFGIKLWRRRMGKAII